MNEQIASVETAMDGIMVEFGDGRRCYFAAEFLSANVDDGSSQIFLDYDPSPNVAGPRASHVDGSRLLAWPKSSRIFKPNTRAGTEVSAQSSGVAAHRRVRKS